MRHVILCIVLAMLASCQKEEAITNKKDYDVYLTSTDNKSLQQSQKAVTFWSNRITSDSIQIIELAKTAGGYTGIFQTTSNILALKKAEQSLTKAVDKAAIGKDGYLRALAQNYITQHRFKEAKTLVEQAHAFGGEKKETNFLKYDVAMELGAYDDAEKLLEKEADFSNYDYLIRRAKWEDYKGNLGSTIQHMEKAKAIAESGKQKGLMLWVYTNLADYYGHAGQIKDAYNHYLMALELDADNAYAKKGIAWIAYAHDNNPDEALRIIQAIEKGNASPDYSLFKAELHAFKGNGNQSSDLVKKFLTQVKDPLYGEMYNAYLIEIYAEDPATSSKAVEMAEREVINRATPATYDLLAYAYLKDGHPDKALKTQEKYVLGQTYEPVAQLHTAQIYKALGMSSKIGTLKEELLEASFELGPQVTKDIKNL